MMIRSHWQNAVLTFAITVLGAGILLPLVRVQPKSVHKYFTGLSDWIRISFIFFLCVVFTGVMFKLLTPRVGHIDHLKNYPPAWLAAFLAWILVAVIDINFGFGINGYRATFGEWIGYGGLSLLIVGWYSGLWTEIYHKFRMPKDEPCEEQECTTLQDIENAPWEEIEAWLESDAPSKYDFLGNQAVAHRLSRLIADGTRSVGIVGPFGAGKTSIVNWVTDRLGKHEVGSRRYFICQHSCWGFETSTAAVQHLLRSAVYKIGTEIDTFQIDSLPQSYRKVFSAAGNWIETLSNLILTEPDPANQFSQLSKILSKINCRLVFIIEDLDRNDTSTFEIQEVLAFLERLKRHRCFSFILTGGLSSTNRIDYTKLCDHIEYLRTIHPDHSSKITKKVCSRCLNHSDFPHVRLGDPNRNYEWNELIDGIFSVGKDMPLPEAVAELLITPRSLRHALSNTCRNWIELYGEIDLRHLIGVNVLRYAAHEALSFLIRHWRHLKQAPNHKIESDSNEAKLRDRLKEDWNCTTQGVEWNTRAALQIMQFLLPATECWLISNDVYGTGKNIYQGVHEERYWRRAINGYIDKEDIRDQVVIRDIQEWLNHPGHETELANKLASSTQYGDVWTTLFREFLANNHDKLLLLCENVIQRALLNEGPSASIQSGGLGRVVRVLLMQQSNQQKNLEWIKKVISESSKVSLLMTIDIWQRFGNSDSLFIDSSCRLEVREHMLNEVRNGVNNSVSLIEMLTPDNTAIIYQTVFDPGISKSRRILANAQSWSWLGPQIHDALKSRNVLAAANCGVLLGARVSGRELTTVDTEVLDQFFGDDATEVIDILESIVEQLPEKDQSLIRNVVGAARQHLAEGILPDEQERKVDTD